MTPALALPCLCAGAGDVYSQREQNLCQITIVVCFCLNPTHNPALEACSKVLLVSRARQVRTSICTICGRSLPGKAIGVGPCLPARDASPATVVTNCPTS